MCINSLPDMTALSAENQFDEKGGKVVCSHSVALKRRWPMSSPNDLCAECGHWIYVYFRFCIRCGEQNPLFSERQFLIERRSTLAEALKQCPTEHALTRAAFAEDPDELLLYRYCQDCGEDVTTSPTTE
jgi:hypothetical protein